jgi:LytS/YehU family sensor histidine kinase
LKKDYEKDKQIAELKLKSIRNQLDPHFTFNALNAIASALYKEDNKTAYTYFAKFSKLIRTSMLYSDKIGRLLSQEIEFTLEYLEIEKFRFRNKFNYKFDVDENVDLMCEVPRMIIQTYADSAITNGLMHRDDGGMLTISIKEDDDQLEIRVTDNGVGIEKSKEYNKDKAFKSAKIMDEFIVLINDMNTSKISIKMYDFEEDDVVAGTEVLIMIPFDIKYKLS